MGRQVRRCRDDWSMVSQESALKQRRTELEEEGEGEGEEERGKHVRFEMEGKCFKGEKGR